MKIAQIVPSLLPAGPVNVALDLSKLFRERGHDVHVFYFDEKDAAVTDPQAQRIGFKEKRDWQQFDVVHSHGLRPDVYIRRNRKRMPVTITTLHNYLKEDLSFQYSNLVARVFTPVWNWACAKHSANVALSQHMKAYYQGFWKNPRIEVIPNTRVLDLVPNPEREAEIQNLTQGKKVLGSVSTVNPRKGLEQLLPFLVQNKDWVYIHIGGGELESIKELALELGVLDQCHFLGPKPRGWEYAAAFDVFALPSYSEGFPLSLIEAIQIGVPIVCSDIPVFQEIFDSKEISRFELSNSESLNTAIKEAYDQRDTFVGRAKQRFERDYSPDVVATRYLELYTQLS